MKAYAVVLGLIATASALPQQQQQQPSPNHGALEVGKTYAVSSDWMIRELPQPRLFEGIAKGKKGKGRPKGTKEDAPCVTKNSLDAMLKNCAAITELAAQTILAASDADMERYWFEKGDAVMRQKIAATYSFLGQQCAQSNETTIRFPCSDNEGRCESGSDIVFMTPREKTFEILLCPHYFSVTDFEDPRQCDVRSTSRQLPLLLTYMTKDPHGLNFNDADDDITKNSVAYYMWSQSFASLGCQGRIPEQFAAMSQAKAPMLQWER